VVAGVEVAEGDQVADNGVLLTLYDPASLEVRARIPAPFLDDLQGAIRAGYPLQGAARVAGEPMELRLSRLAGEADPSGVDALFDIPSGPQGLRAGQVLRFTVRRMPQANAVAVPYEAIYGGDRVFTLREGRMHGLSVEVLGGVGEAEEGERLLVRSAELRPGDRLVVTRLPNAVDGLRAEAVP
jgi:multidrug efflux pump subunit AcrA (membrane-fusion protein)